MLLVVGAVYFLQGTVDSRFWADDSTLAVTCVSSNVTVCLPSGYGRESDGLSEYTTRLNALAASLDVGQEAKVQVVRAVSLGMQQRRTSEAPMGERWITMDAELGGGQLPSYIASNNQEFLYPPKCFGERGWPSSSWSPGALLFSGYVSFLGLGLDPMKSSDLAAIANLPELSRDRWLRQSWQSTLACSGISMPPTA